MVRVGAGAGPGGSFSVGRVVGVVVVVGGFAVAVGGINGGRVCVAVVVVVGAGVVAVWVGVGVGAAVVVGLGVARGV